MDCFATLMSSSVILILKFDTCIIIGLNSCKSILENEVPRKSKK